MTFSAGVFQIPDNMAIEEALSEADRFLYLAKENGRNCILSADESFLSPRKKILITEDDETTSYLIGYLLQQEGFEVERFSNGKSALEAAESSSFSLGILDVQIPEMDGFELLSKLRKLHTFSDVPIVMLSGMGHEHALIKGFELGADDYITKPFSPQELLARIRRLLKKHENPLKRH